MGNGGFQPWGLVPFAAMLIIAFVFGLRRRRKATKLKLYTNSGKTMVLSDILIPTINGQKAVLGRDQGGSYTVVPVGVVNVVAQFVFSARAVQAEEMIEHQFEKHTNYGIYFDEAKRTFQIREVENGYAG